MYLSWALEEHNSRKNRRADCLRQAEKDKPTQHHVVFNATFTCQDCSTRCGHC